MKKSFIVLAALVLFLLTSCNGFVTSGTVLSKKHQAAYNYPSQKSVQSCTSNYSRSGKYLGQSCTTFDLPTTVYVPDKWIIKLENCKDQSKCEYGTINVSYEDYERVQIGQYYSED